MNILLRHAMPGLVRLHAEACHETSVVQASVYRSSVTRVQSPAEIYSPWLYVDARNATDTLRLRRCQSPSRHAARKPVSGPTERRQVAKRYFGITSLAQGARRRRKQLAGDL